MRKTKWTDKMLNALSELYPVETTSYTAACLQMSETAVKNQARKLGLSKIAKSKWMVRAEHVQNHFHQCSFSEMAKELGITKMSVSRIAAKLGLTRTKAESYQVASRIRLDMIRRERRRVIFGLEPITQLKVVSNRAKVRLRSRLKSKGYIVAEEHNVLFYTHDIERKNHLESRGMKLGLRFLPFQCESSLLPTSI
ncbi:MarR family transcriptional regulator [Bacteroides cellulosilyticus]|uniref:MarR family transcriptional regulator n=1 Tax=Bacteroides cellulosilyticus TaxID=246787 RepID=UPI001D05D4ED|nr:MarR family transcriptional regulator [Bacteroides cellulosilyticus]MCB6594510.1 MarR family transcriptional regulator [Bacteroides cellulosilyticus]